MKTRLFNAFLVIPLCILSMPTIAQSCGVVEPFTPVKVDKLQLPAIMQSSLEQSPVSLVNLWAVWCSPCRKELPMLVKLEQSQRHNIAIHTLHVGPKTVDVEQVMEDVGLHRVNKGFLSDMSSMSTMGIHGLPATLVAINGEVKFIANGYLHHNLAEYQNWLICLEENS